MNFIQLTVRGSGVTVYVNMDLVVFFERVAFSHSSVLTFVKSSDEDEVSLSVVEGPETILNLARASLCR